MQVASLFLLLEVTNAFKAIPKLNGMCYVKQGDINLGVFNTLSRKGTDKYCSNALLEPSRAQYPEVTKYAIAEINNSTTILPNISLGYVMIDTCTTDLVALARTLNFITGPTHPQLQEQTSQQEDGAHVSRMDGFHEYNTTSSISPPDAASDISPPDGASYILPPDGAYVDNCSDGQTFYKVAGILGPWMSSSSVMAAPLLRY